MKPVKPFFLTYQRANLTISKTMKFRQKFIMAALSLIAAVPASAQEKSATTSKFVGLEDKWNDAYRRADIEAMNALLADDFIITVEDGVTYSKTGYIAHLRNTSEHVAVAQISDVKVRVHDNVAIVTGAYHEAGTSNGKQYEYRDRFTDVWMHSDVGWQLIASHYAVVPKE